MRPIGQLRDEFKTLLRFGDRNGVNSLFADNAEGGPMDLLHTSSALARAVVDVYGKEVPRVEEVLDEKNVALFQLGDLIANIVMFGGSDKDHSVDLSHVKKAMSIGACDLCPDMETCEDRKAYLAEVGAPLSGGYVH